MASPLLRPRSVRAVLLGLVSALAVQGLWSLDWMQGSEAALSDRWHQQLGQRVAADDVVMVWLDDATLAELEEPLVLYGKHFGAAIARAHQLGAKLFGLDVTLTISADKAFQSWNPDTVQARTWDASLYEQMHAGNVVASAFLQSARNGELLLFQPHPGIQAVLRDERAQVGLVNLPLDADNVVRRFRTELLEQPHTPQLGLGTLLAVRAAEQDPHASSWQLGGRTVQSDDSLRRIAWTGPPGSFPGVSLHSLVTPGGLTPEEEALFPGRIAILGASYFGSDRFSTPYDGQHGPMSGAEIHANIVATLLSGRRIQEPALPARLALLALLGTLSTAAFLRARPEMALLGGTLGGIAWLGACLGAFATLDLLLPAASGLVTVGLCFTGTYALRFTREEQQRRAMRHLFQRYVPDAVVTEVLRAPQAAGLGGRAREITVLFTDIRGFTSLSEQLSPEELVELLNAWFSRACRPIEDHGGVVDKFIGDAVMAIFGAPIAVEDHAARGVRAAVEMAREAELFVGWVERRFPERALAPFAIGVGVHTGPAVVGNVGFERRVEYTAVGDTVNVASRVEGLTRQVEATVLVTGATLALAGLDVETGETASLHVRGRHEPVEVVEVLGLREDPHQDE